MARASGGCDIRREDLRILVFPERGGEVREWRLKQSHRALLSTAGAVVAALVAVVVFILSSAYRDIAVAQHLRQELAITREVQAQNSKLQGQLAAQQKSERLAMQQTAVMAEDLRHVAGLLGLHASTRGHGLDNFVAQLMSLRRSLPSVLSAAGQRATFLAHKPDMLPVQGPIVSGFGWRTNPFGGLGTEFHDGVDIAVPQGTPVHATGAGVVTYAGWYSGYGLYVQIDHGYGIVSFYGHNSKILVHVGEHVVRGQVVSLSGDTGHSTGPHVHFGMHYRGLPVNPLQFIESNPSGVN